MKKEEKARKILDILREEFPNASIALNFSKPLELLVATILSAQATDKLVNKVTAELFKKYRSARDYAEKDPAELERDISSINFYRNKARSIRNCCKKLVEDFGGEVPSRLEDLVKLPGVGRKTANIVLGNAFGIPGLAVDTHVKRVSRRLGLTESENPDDIEKDLCAIIDRKRWTEATNLLILHGRNACKARGPKCEICRLRPWCEYYKEVVKGKPA